MYFAVVAAIYFKTRAAHITIAYVHVENTGSRPITGAVGFSFLNVYLLLSTLFHVLHVHAKNKFINNFLII